MEEGMLCRFLLSTVLCNFQLNIWVGSKIGVKNASNDAVNPVCHTVSVPSTVPLPYPASRHSESSSIRHIGHGSQGRPYHHSDGRARTSNQAIPHQRHRRIHESSCLYLCHKSTTCERAVACEYCSILYFLGHCRTTPAPAIVSNVRTVVNSYAWASVDHFPSMDSARARFV